jgi:hypothetical protein
MTIERIEQRLRRVTAALDAANIPYAVIGGNAVAAWVAKANPAASRTTKNVDLLVNPADLDRITDVMQQLGFVREDRSHVLFIDPEEPARHSGVRLIRAGEKVRPYYLHPAPSVAESVRDKAGLLVLDLPALVRMKLTSFRPIDRVHMHDLLGIGLIDDRIRTSLPADLSERLDEVEKTRDTSLDD